MQSWTAIPDRHGWAEASVRCHIRRRSGAAKRGWLQIESRNLPIEHDASLVESDQHGGVEVDIETAALGLEAHEVDYFRAHPSTSSSLPSGPGA